MLPFIPSPKRRDPAVAVLAMVLALTTATWFAASVSQAHRRIVVLGAEQTYPPDGLAMVDALLCAIDGAGALHCWPDRAAQAPDPRHCDRDPILGLVCRPSP